MDHLTHNPSSTSADRWEELKPIIEQLYLVDNMKLADVALAMNASHHFNAL